MHSVPFQPIKGRCRTKSSNPAEWYGQRCRSAGLAQRSAVSGAACPHWTATSSPPPGGSATRRTLRSRWRTICGSLAASCWSTSSTLHRLRSPPNLKILPKAGNYFKQGIYIFIQQQQTCQHCFILHISLLFSTSPYPGSPVFCLCVSSPTASHGKLVCGFPLNSTPFETPAGWRFTQCF